MHVHLTLSLRHNSKRQLLKLPYAHVENGAPLANVIDAQGLKEEFDWDATTTDVFFKRTGG